jgi:hypothetical protein
MRERVEGVYVPTEGEGVSCVKPSEDGECVLYDAVVVRNVRRPTGVFMARMLPLVSARLSLAAAVAALASLLLVSAAHGALFLVLSAQMHRDSARFPLGKVMRSGTVWYCVGVLIRLRALPSVIHVCPSHTA